MVSEEHRTTSEYWQRPGLGDAILDALRDADIDLDALTVDTLAPLDQFHAGGAAATRTLARLLNPAPGTRVLDAGGGLGGPARLLAAEYGCDVTVLDLTEDYIEAGRLLTARTGLQDRIRFQAGDATRLPFPDASFDAVWTQNAGMNIADKVALYAGFHRVLHPGGLLAIQEPVAGAGGPLHFPVMWAEDASTSFLVTGPDLRALIEAAGFRTRSWDERAAQHVPTPSGAVATPATTLQALVMGERLAEIRANSSRNIAEGRVATVDAVLERV